MTNDCKTCPVSTGTHKPAEALHQQIDEPQSEALRLAAWLLHRGMSGIKQNDIEASNQLRWLHAESLQHKQELAAYRFTVANREARIAELESQLEAIGAGGVEPLRKQAAAQQAVQAAYPHLPHSVADVVDFMDGRGVNVDFSHPAPAGGTSLYTADQMRAYVATDRAQRAAAPQAAAHPDDAAVDALAALMKVKLAKQRAKGYGGWNDKTQCPQQRLSDMLRAHVDKGDPVDVANFCAFLVARGEGIAAAPQAVQAEVPKWIDDPHDIEQGQMLNPEWVKLQQADAPAYPAEGVPAPDWRELAARVMDALADAQEQTNTAHPDHVKCYPSWEAGARWLRWHAEMFRSGKPIGNGAGQPAVLAALAATHPTQQGMDAQALKQSFREYLSVSEHIDAGGHAMDSIATDLTRIVLAEEEVSAVIARRVHCNTSGQSGEDAENIRAAAQAKQGGAA